MAIMTTKHKPYPTYRPSGVEWLDEIPAHWEVKRLKHLGELQAGAGFPDDEQGDRTQEYPFYKVGDMGRDVNRNGMIEWQHTVSSETARRLRAFIFPPSTIVFAKVGAALLLNRRRMLTSPSCIDNNMMGFIPHVPDPIWMMYWLSGLDLRKLANPGAVPSVNEGQIREQETVLPSLPEQRAISAFLDRETARIDALVARKERLIELLQEKRTALISRAVTKGLDPNVPMKDSGVEWLGEIPAHWEVKRVKHICLVRRGASPRPIANPAYFDANGEYGWVRIADVTASNQYLNQTSEYVSELGRSLSVSLEPGELIVSIAGSVGKPIITDMKCCIHDGFVHFLGVSEHLEYLYYILSSDQPYIGLGKVGTQLNLNTDTIGDIQLPVPSLSEQRRISERLDSQTTKIDALIAKVLEAIERFQELRSALISAAVTGRIDVREEAA